MANPDQVLEKPTYRDWIDTQEYRGDELAAALEWNLSMGLDFSIPGINWDDPLFQIPEDLLNKIHTLPHAPVIEDITTREYGGAGAFDAFMESFHNHLDIEFKAKRITGADYANAWVSGFQTCLAQAVQFVLNKDKVFWELLLQNLAAITAMIAILKAKVELALLQAQFHTTRATYCLTKLKLSTEDAAFSNAMENMEAARAQTLDNRLSDGSVVRGAIGKQKDLYDQQITSFKRNDENKHIEQLVQLWVAEKTVDEGVLVPDAGTNPNISSALSQARNNLNL